MERLLWLEDGPSDQALRDAEAAPSFFQLRRNSATSASRRAGVASMLATKRRQMRPQQQPPAVRGPAAPPGRSSAPA